MQTSKFYLSRLSAFVWTICLSVTLVPPTRCNSLLADYPDHPFTLDLGPGNGDALQTVKKCIVRDFRTKGQAAIPGECTDMSGRDLRRAVIHLQLLTLQGVKFDGADLTGAGIDETFFANCSFRGARLRNVWASCSEIRPSCDLTDADISGSYLYLTSEQLRSTANYKRRDLSATILYGDFRGTSFADFNLRGTVFYFCYLERCDFTGANIAQGAFVCRLKASPGETDRHYPFTKEQLRSTKSFRERDLDQVGFQGCDFRDADFSGQSLGRFVWCDLAGADLTNADFPETLASGYSLPSTRPTPGGRVCPTLNGYGFTETALTPEQFYSTRTFKSGRLPSHFALEKMDLDGWDFSGKDLRGVSFRFSSLKGANLTDARGGDFLYTRGLTKAQIESTWNWKNRNFSELGFKPPEEFAPKRDQKQREVGK